ncbi:Mitosis inhibitor protein kinase wee1 [Fusarium oxysporum f. sp. albedinis]|nr:Mitosis inhibitor protein kinase wee1 [Fusarium oxysporum f. sp. albedinis]
MFGNVRSKGGLQRGESPRRVLGERKGQRARRSRIFFFVISDLYELERREEDDVCVYNKKEMFVITTRKMLFWVIVLMVSWRGREKR